MTQENYKREKLLKTAADIVRYKIGELDLPRDDFGPTIPSEYIEEVLAKAKDEYLEFIVKDYIVGYINGHYVEKYHELHKGEKNESV